MTIRQLDASNTEDFVNIRQSALIESPFSFGASVDDDRMRSEEYWQRAFAQPGEAVFGAFAPDLVGIVGFMRERTVKRLHKGIIWGTYVQPAFRGQGIGRSLLHTALEFGRSLQGLTHVHLSVSETAPAAKGLYESVGFVSWGVEPAAMRIDGRDAAELHMVMNLAEGE